VLARRRTVLEDEVEAGLAGDVAEADTPEIGGRPDTDTVEKREDDAGGKDVAERREAPYRVRAR
jgi:hypothetical protein